MEDYVFATYGHGLSDNSVIQHYFFWTDLVVNDLKDFVSYKFGWVYMDIKTELIKDIDTIFNKNVDLYVKV